MDGRMLALIDDTDLNTFLEAIRAGDTQTVAARKVGWSLTALLRRLKRDDELAKAFAEAKEIGIVARADQIDQEMDEWVHEEGASASLRIARAKRWHPGYRDRVDVTQTVEHRGELSPQVQRMLERVKAQLEAGEDVVDDDADTAGGAPGAV